MILQESLDRAKARIAELEKERDELRAKLEAALARESRLREALEDCERYFSHASEKHVLPNGVVEAACWVQKALHASDEHPTADAWLSRKLATAKAETWDECAEAFGGEDGESFCRKKAEECRKEAGG